MTGKSTSIRAQKARYGALIACAFLLVTPTAGCHLAPFDGASLTFALFARLACATLVGWVAARGWSKGWVYLTGIVASVGLEVVSRQCFQSTNWLEKIAREPEYFLFMGGFFGTLYATPVAVGMAFLLRWCGIEGSKRASAPERERYWVESAASVPMPPLAGFFGVGMFFLLLTARSNMGLIHWVLGTVMGLVALRAVYLLRASLTRSRGSRHAALRAEWSQPGVIIRVASPGVLELRADSGTYRGSEPLLAVEESAWLEDAGIVEAQAHV